MKTLSRMQVKALVAKLSTELSKAINKKERKQIAAIRNSPEGKKADAISKQLKELEAKRDALTKERDDLQEKACEGTPYVWSRWGGEICHTAGYDHFKQELEEKIILGTIDAADLDALIASIKKQYE